MNLNIVATIFIFLSIITCNAEKEHGVSKEEKKDTVMHKYTNNLINETSPYLLQHAHNPVNWYAWGEEALEKARNENKLLLISIGYAACHWCHVMEHESFEDEQVAELMNEFFVCIKIDREERPDIDQIYMNAVQLMNQRGGWPLNCFATSDGKPFFGGTYFPKQQWKNILNKVNEEYKLHPEKIREYADRLANGVAQSELIPLNPKPALFKKETLDEMVEKWADNFDAKEGGPNRAPKFLLPNNYQFLLRYAFLTEDDELKEHVKLTLDKMAMGGIYDQLGGGFARYSTDIKWKVPHFEKMLYDNGQLISLFAEAYQATKDDLYKDIVYETVDFVKRELMSDEHAFYSSLDADSEGVEGKFYVWTKEELQEQLKADFEVFADYYNVNPKGLWEHGNYILLRDEKDAKVAEKHGMSADQLKKQIEKNKEKLLSLRNKRIRPGLDDKSLTSWNALMLKGLVDAYNAFDDQSFLELALKNAQFIASAQIREDGGLNHNYKEGRSTINGYLEDYCFTIEAFIGLYEATLNEKWLLQSKELMEYAIEHFYDEKSGMFFFTSDIDDPLIARKMEVNDNVIPGSCSAIAKSLFLLGHYFDDKDYTAKGATMLNNVQEYIASYGSGYSNWGMLMLNNVFPFYEIAIAGKEAKEKIRELNTTYVPNKMIVAGEGESALPLLENKLVEGATMIYVCQNKTCQLPVTEIEEALKQIK